MNGEKLLPNNIWRLIASAAMLLFLGAALLVTLILAGVFDPHPLGHKVVDRRLSNISTTDNATNTYWMDEKLRLVGSSVILTAHLADGENDSGYGIVLGTSEDALIFAVSPLGYLSYWKQGQDADNQSEEQIIPWRTWPHIKFENEPNEIWIDVEEGLLTSIRVNGELLPVSPVAVPGDAVGLWVKSFGEPSEIAFDRLEIFEVPE